MNKEILKDFMGNTVKVGDKIVVCDKTYSKTPFMRIGKVKKIKFEYFKNGNLSDVLVEYSELGRSDFTMDFLENHNYEQRDGFLREIRITSNGHLNILKI